MADRFWVGGASGDTTNWHNANNWSATSGGAGGAGVPTSGDAAKFDANSNGYDCVATAAMVAASISSGYTTHTKSLSRAGYSLTMSGAISWQGTGSLALANSTISVGSINVSYAAACDISLAIITVIASGGISFYSSIGTLTIGSASATFTVSAIYYQSKGSATYWKKVTINSGVKLSVTNGSLIVKNDGATSITLADATAILSLAGGQVTSYSTGTCKPIEDSGGSISATTGYTLKFAPTDTSTITLPKINGIYINVECVAVSSKTINYDVSNTITCNQIVLGSNVPGNCTTKFRFNGYTVSAGLLKLGLSSSTSATVTVEWGGSETTFRNATGLDWSGGSYAASVTNLDLSTAGSKIIFTGPLTTQALKPTNGTCNFTAGTSTIEFSGTNTKVFTSSGKTLYKVVVNQPHATNTFTFNTALTCTQLQVEPNCIVLWKDGVTHTVSSYTAGDWDGSAGNLVTFNSVSAGNTYTFANPAGMTVSYMKVQDSVATNVINAYNGTNVNLGNNILWQFTTGVPCVPVNILLNSRGAI